MTSTSPDPRKVQLMMNGMTDGMGGGDFDECYELVLREARTKFDWSPGDDVTRSVVVIGDATPHMAA